MREENRKILSPLFLFLTDRTRKDRHAGRNNSGSIVRQWSNRVSDKLRICPKTGVSTEVEETDECEKCGQVAEQGRTHRIYSRSKHLLQRI